MSVSDAPLRLRGSSRALFEHVLTLESEAGIGYEAERARALRDPRPALRRLCFDVTDERLRSELISAWRKAEAAELHEARRYLSDAERALREAKSKSEWSFLSAAIGVTFVYSGHEAAGLAGALGGLLIAFVLVMQTRENRIRLNSAEVAAAQERVAVERTSYEALARQAPLFSNVEEQTGRPDLLDGPLHN